MREYRMFFGSETGVFGGARNVWLATDRAAVAIGRRLLEQVAGVDIWRGERRVALLTRASPALAVSSRLAGARRPQN